MSVENGNDSARFAQLEQDGDLAGENGNVLFGKDSVQNMPTKEGRVFKKAKRTIRLSPQKDEYGQNGLSWLPVNGHKAVVLEKNSRKSRDGKGRGMPKKGGAGGKGTWGAPGSELYETSECKDAHDPNYDSDSQDAYVVQKVALEIPPGELVKVIEPILKEYLENGDMQEVLSQFDNFNIAKNKYKILEMAVNLALDRHDPQRELTSQLIADLNGSVMSKTDIGQGFDELLANLSDLTLDTPEAPTLVGQFIARAMADDCLPSSFVDDYKGRVHSSGISPLLISKRGNLLALVILAQGRLVNRSLYSLPLVTFKMQMLLKEFLSSGDITEATRCLKELDVPHFHHELIYQGAKRLFEDMPDICIDVPAAYTALEKLGNKLHDEGIMSEYLYKEMPVRGRKRFVSEGDGGKVKEQTIYQ
ncbi:hypothetical protein LSH36_75g08009 [Paralvinella palmiformis]|uniref:MI domain-containing protein n=1 Tax=Paralvinella palmiformis TaxID=53620 RepID=A0AAD9ND03_9ANNE|nr:hypothetical protein LSH36_75g08009 [Paralvinella palmiformis]